MEPIREIVQRPPPASGEQISGQEIPYSLMSQDLFAVGNHSSTAPAQGLCLTVTQCPTNIGWLLRGTILQYRQGWARASSRQRWLQQQEKRSLECPVYNPKSAKTHLLSLMIITGSRCKGLAAGSRCHFSVPGCIQLSSSGEVKCELYKVDRNYGNLSELSALVQRPMVVCHWMPGTGQGNGLMRWSIRVEH